MKKYFILTLLISNAFLFANAQTSGKDSVLSVMAKEVCTKISNKDFSGESSESFKMELGLAIMPSISSRMELLQKYYGTDVSKEILERVGEEVGVKLAVECPAFIKLITDNSKLLKKSANEDNTVEQTISGTLQKIVPGDFTYFQVKDPNGRLIKIWWMEQFEGAEQLSQQQMNKPVMVTYNVKQTYNSQMQEYISIKVATKLQLIK